VVRTNPLPVRDWEVQRRGERRDVWRLRSVTILMTTDDNGDVGDDVEMDRW